MVKQWRVQAKSLFLVDHAYVSEIARTLGLARETVTRFLTQLPEYPAELAYRKQRSRERRLRYKENWNKTKYAAATATKETIRREHDLAAIILSKERHCHE